MFARPLTIRKPQVSDHIGGQCGRRRNPLRRAPHRGAGGLGDVLRRDAVRVVQLRPGPGLAVVGAPQDREPRAGAGPRQSLGHGRAQPADHVVVLHGDHPAAAVLGLADHALGVQGLQRVDVHDARLDPVPGQLVGGLQGLLHGGAAPEQAHVAALAELHDLAELEPVFLAVHVVELLAGQAEEGRSLVLAGQVLHRRDGLRRVARLDHRHVREGPHGRDVLQGHLRGTVVADPDAGVGPGDPHVGLVVAHRHADDLQAPRDEARERRGPGHLAGQGQPRGHAHHVRFRDPAFDEAVGVGLPEQVRVVRLHEVAVEDHVPGILAHLNQGLAERLPRRLAPHHEPPSSASNRRRLSSPSISPFSWAIAMAPCSSEGALPCQSGFSSIHDTPLPFTVCATITVPRSRTVSASSSASRTWAMSWPSISRTFHPNALHFEPTGSMSRMFTTLSDCWTWFWSRITQRFDRPCLPPSMAASHSWPAWDSPSPTMQYTRQSAPSSLPAMAMPTAIDSPWPSDPVAASMPGHRIRSGCPWSGEPNLRRVHSCSSSKNPRLASAAYTIGTQCPFDSTNRSRSGQWGSSGRRRILWKYRAAMTSADDSVPPGWPEPAFTSISMSVTRSRRAMSFSRSTRASRPSTSVAVSIRRLLVRSRRSGPRTGPRAAMRERPGVPRAYYADASGPIRGGHLRAPLAGPAVDRPSGPVRRTPPHRPVRGGGHPRLPVHPAP